MIDSIVSREWSCSLATRYYYEQLVSLHLIRDLREAGLSQKHARQVLERRRRPTQDEAGISGTSTCGHQLRDFHDQAEDLVTSLYKNKEDISISGDHCSYLSGWWLERSRVSLPKKVSMPDELYEPWWYIPDKFQLFSPWNSSALHWTRQSELDNWS